MQSEIYTSLPCLIQSFDPAKRTVTAQPVTKAQAQNPDGSFSWIALPILPDVPVYFPEGGGVTLTFPIKSGDEALVVIANRCIDAWWQSGGIQIQADIRMHDLSDGFAFVGVSSVPRVISNISTTRAQFRSNDGQAFVEIDPTSHLIRAKTSGDLTAEVAGNVSATVGGTLLADVTGAITINSPVSVTINTPTVFCSQTLSCLNLLVRPGGVSSMSGGAITMSSMNLSYSNCATAYSGGTMTFNGKNITDTHIHSGVTTGGGATGGVV